MAAPTSDEVLRQIGLMYGHQTSKEEREASDKWLQEFRKQEAAWGIIDQLLTNSKDPSVLNFCATSLTWRIKNSKPDQALSAKLQQCVLNHIVRLRQGSPKNVLQQLSLTIVKLLVLHPNPTLVPDLCNSLSQPETVDILLLFLDTLGEEAGFILEDMEDGMEAQRADDPEINAEHPLLVSVCPNTRLVMDLIHSVWTGAQGIPARLSFVFKVYAKWLRFGSLQPEHVAASPITQASVQALGNPQLQDDASEVITELAFLLNGKDVDWNPVSSFLASNILNIYNLLASVGEDADAAETLTRALARVCRMYVRDVSVVTQDMATMINIMVKAASFPDQKVFAHTLGFWHRLNLSLQAVAKKSPEQHQQCASAIEGPLNNIVPVLLKQAMYPVDCDTWTKDDHDESTFDEFREHDLYEAVEDCSRILTPIKAVLKAYPLLTQNITTPANWREVEAVLYYITCTPPSKPLEDTLYPQLLTISSTLSQYHWRVQAAYIQVIKIAGPWINTNGGELMPALLNLTMSTLAHPRIHKVAIATVCSLCKTCTSHMVRLFPVLKDRAMLTGSMSLENAKKLMEGLGSLVSELPVAELAGAVEGLCAPILMKLQSIGADAELINIEVQKLASLFVGVDNSAGYQGGEATRAAAQAWAGAFGVMWPVLKDLIAKAINSEQLMEQLTGLLRSVMLACDLEFRAHLEPLIQTLVSAFGIKPHSCLLWLMGSVITVFGREDAYVGPIMDVLNVLIGRTVKMLAEEAVGPNSDFIQEIFYLMTMATKRFPIKLMASPLAAAVFDVALASIVNTDVKREAAYLTLKFFLDATEPQLPSEEKAAIQAFLQPRGDKLAEAMLQAVINRDLDTSDRVGDIIWNLREMKEPQLRVWILHGLSALPEDVPPKARQACLESISTATKRDQMYTILEKLHRAPPCNWR
eukprot:TRINITY_DN12102_c0_g1_i1.p1 TRINITY_DN12102_c0_g1~~TRINITY_DN12102_c0_g1_i1.p1  ORF type:complete len:925 (+),score=164.26 TRINITY_DN12102_c0_g1_i1:54-2828(+)